MSLASKTSHHLFTNTAMPYVSNSSPLSTDPQYISGSKDVLTNLRGFAELRPGFATAVETVATSFTALKRLYLWRKWGSTFYAMFCDVSGGVAKVYKYAIGTDTSAVLIHTSSVSTPFDFVVDGNICYFGNGTDMKFFRAATTADTTAYNWGITAPTNVPTFSTGGTGINAAVGYYYRYTYWNDNTSHESSPSGLSACTGVFSNKTVTVSWTASGDSQVTHVKLYRTSDGGSTDPTKMHLVQKVAIGTTNYADALSDATIASLEVAPQANYNDPPPASKGFVWSQGRIWGFANASTWFTGQEEIAKGVPAQCVVGGALGVNGGGNVYNWDSEVTAHAAMEDGVAVFLANRVWKIEGNSLDTFLRYKLLDRRGCRNHTAVATLGGSVAWLDTASQVWLSDLGEIGLSIRPDLSGIDHSQAYMSIHISGNYHWLCLLDGGNGKLYVFDLDTKRWMPPWNVGTTAAALHSGETASGTVDLVLARNGTKALKLVSTLYADDGSAYASELRTGMLWIAQASDFLARYDRSNPQWKGSVESVEFKTNTIVPSACSQLNDDDPSQAAYTSLAAYTGDADVPQGTYIKLTRYPSAPTTNTGRMTSVDVSWTAGAGAWKLYQWDISYSVDFNL